MIRPNDLNDPNEVTAGLPAERPRQGERPGGGRWLNEVAAGKMCLRGLDFAISCPNPCHSNIQLFEYQIPCEPDEWLCNIKNQSTENQSVA
nr:MAG TPA: hypothetical protein [Caudoviricetes sp.]